MHILVQSDKELKPENGIFQIPAKSKSFKSNCTKMTVLQSVDIFINMQITHDFFEHFFPQEK